MGTTVTKPGSDWKDGFLFLGNQLALDFLNTRPVQNGEALELLPDFTALLRWFRAAELLTTRQAADLSERYGESAEARLTLEAMWDLREKLRKEVLSWEGGALVHRATWNELNRLMAEHPMRTRLRESSGRLSKESWFETAHPQGLLAPLAHSAAQLFVEVDRERVRKCAECILHFHDTSKKGTRRWCSMQLCGNRLKVAAYTARRRAL